MDKRTFTGKPGKEFKFQYIKYEKKDGRATITFNRASVYNAINYGILREMNAALKDASWDDNVGVLVLTGAGDKAFSTGADLNEQEGFLQRPRDYWKWMGEFIEVHERLRNLGKPSIARLNGIVVGGGNEFNMSCDLAVAADDIYIRQVGTSHGSVALAGATQFLPLIVGDRRAREILLLNEQIPAAKALEWGLVNYVVPRDQLDEAVIDPDGPHCRQDEDAKNQKCKHGRSNYPVMSLNGPIIPFPWSWVNYRASSHTRSGLPARSPRGSRRRKRV